MATESPIRMIEGSGKWPPHSEVVGFGPPSASIAIDELASLLKGQRFQGSNSKGNSVPNRSGSAPPSMEGSFAAVQNIILQQNSTLDASLASIKNTNDGCQTEEQLPADPSYVAYYRSNVNLNPRLPPPLISSQDRHFVRNNWRRSFDDSNSSNLRFTGGNLPTHKEEPEDDRSPTRPHDDVVEHNGGLSSGQFKNLADSIQDSVEKTVNYDDGPRSLHGPSIPSAEEKLSPNSRGDSPSKTPLYRRGASNADVRNDDGTSISSGNDGDVSVIGFGIDAINISSHSKFDNRKNHQLENKLQNIQTNMQQLQDYQQQNNHFQGTTQAYVDMNQFPHAPPNFSAEVQPILQSSGFTPPLYATPTAYITSSSSYYPNFQPTPYFPPQYSVSGYAYNPAGLSPYVSGYLPNNGFPLSFGTTAPSFSAQTSGAADTQNLNKYYGPFGFANQPPFTDISHLQQFQQPYNESYGLSGYDYPTVKNSPPGGQIHAVDMRGVQKYKNQGIVSPNTLNPRSVDTSSPYYLGSPTNLVTSQFVTPALPGSRMGVTSFSSEQNELIFSPGPARNTGYPRWQGSSGQVGLEEAKTYSLLEELKTGKSRRFELSDIVGHIVEFSADQHGSRFIQQKLENCSADEKGSVFKEVLPSASKLMTDVFGNYVIQKFFEYGNAEQRKELADQLEGQILPLSLQMYGCRVIQKALDVIELQQKTKLVHELDGHVLRCVRDQNGNHVIQKCIESIPTENIKFIISSFRGQVAALSMHPYGCRVIQRVLEHSTDELESQFIVDEILESVYALAQDQYGNYVTQHVLERGKAHERSRIVRKLSGHIVQLSQHKFASNVIEKCLEYGDSASKEFLIREIVGHGDGNDNLLALVKDQYANYVVQKIIQTCSGDQRELLLGRIRIHLNSLKKYTYGKHIVTRFEQLYGGEIQTSES